jgi:hypothetical protein
MTSPSARSDDHAACDAEIARLGEHVARLGREHARHSLAVSAHKGRGDQMESRAIRAEKQLARFLGYTEEYDKLAEQAADSRRNADLVAELRRRVAVLERSVDRAAAAERERIRQLAIRNNAVSAADEGTCMFFADLLGPEVQERSEEKEAGRGTGHDA